MLEVPNFSIFLVCNVDCRIVFWTSHMFKRYYKSYSFKDYLKCYEILELPDGSDQECVRKAFLDLCKKYHPDSGRSTANAAKFQEIDSAYRTLQHKFAEERWKVNEGVGEYGLYYKEKKENTSNEKPKVFDITHTAPQHRQYLTFEGVGSGTPFEREKQYEKYRRSVAAEHLFDHQVKKFSEGNENTEPILITKDKTEAKKIKTRYGMERLVEDLIQESMAKGHFDNLRGQGKPLPQLNYNPYVDFVTHKMNEILIDNGFTPEWITLQREIRDESQSIREILKKERGKLGPLPLSFYEKKKWNQTIENLEKSVQKLNQKINKYNLLVPVLQKQKLYFNLEKENCDILQSQHCKSKNVLVEEKKVEEKNMNKNMFSMVLSLFK